MNCIRSTYEFSYQKSAINNLLLGDLKNKVICLPPLNEQKRILDEVGKLFNVCDKLQLKIVGNCSLQCQLANCITTSSND